MADDTTAPTYRFSFDRYLNGTKMADGIEVTGSSLEAAIPRAINLCRSRPGNVTTLVLRGEIARG